MRRSQTYWRRTKIVCTIGPASGSETVTKRLIQAGMDVARLNMSHGTPAEHAAYIRTVRKVSAALEVPVCILLDLPGPKYRVGKLQGGQVRLRKGEEITLTEHQVEGDSSLLPITLPGLSKGLRPGQTVLLDDGALQARVLRTTDTDVLCRVTVGGVIAQGKGVVVPGMPVSRPFVTDTLRDMVLFAIEQQADYIALSFVSHADNVNDVRALLRTHGADIPIVAKIERREALKSFQDILRASDAIMVARGDLGVEIPLERLPLIQKDLIRKCNRAGKPVITATEMLQSMVASPRPVRAETTDVSNAIFDGTDAVMLSAETSVGQYPVRAVRMMDRIAAETEKRLNYEVALSQRTNWVGSSTEELISYNACVTAHRLGAKAIVAFTQSGSTAGRVSKYRPRPLIIAVSPADISRRLVLYWGVHPFRRDVPDSVSGLFSTAARLARDVGLAKPGDLIVVTGGIPLGQSGSTNLLKVERVV